MRLDRWLWCARFYKTRGLAADAIKGGHIKMDDQRCKPAKSVAIGDRLSITKGAETWRVTVASLPARRGPAKEAQASFTESEESIEQRLEQRTRRRTVAEQAPTAGRPDKLTRRLLRARRRRG